MNTNDRLHRAPEPPKYIQPIDSIDSVDEKVWRTLRRKEQLATELLNAAVMDELRGKQPTPPQRALAALARAYGEEPLHEYLRLKEPWNYEYEG